MSSMSPAHALPGTSAKHAAPERFLDETKALACIHCGLCLGSCPTYLETGNENDSPRGRIYLMRALQDGRVPVEGTATKHLDLCLGCRACEAVCPSGVQYGALLEHARDHIESHHWRGWFQTFLRRIAIEQVFPYPGRMELALAPLRALRALGLDRWMPKILRDATDLVPRDLAPVDLPEVVRPEPGVPTVGRVGFVSGCVMPVMFGPTHRSTLNLLRAEGYEIHIPRNQGCCGALFSHSGRLDAARDCARRNIVAFEAAGVDRIVINAAGCGSTLKEYGSLLEDDPTWAARGAAFSRRVCDLSEILPPRPATVTSGGGKVTFHDACHLAHAQRITRPPRDLVRAVAGADFVELPEADVCCGSAGTYNLTEPAMAARLQTRKVENILRTGADTVVTTNPGCLLQIRAGLDAAGAQRVRTLHLADYLAERRQLLEGPSAI